jgi:hypothetical protein
MAEPLFVAGKTIDVQASTGNFIVKDRFVLNMERNDRLMIAYIVGHFPQWFNGKVEGPVAASTLRYYELQYDAGDRPILEALGGEASVETTMTEVFALMDRQRSGQGGILAINGWGNIFYVRDELNVLRVVYVHWCDDAWGVEASLMHRKDVEYPIRDRVFARVRHSV